MDVARCFTGWTIDAARGLRATRSGNTTDDGFVFRKRMHDDGQKKVLGHTVAAGGGENDGLAVIDLLARDAHTARFISLKPCRRFVCDDPPAALVDRVAGVFRKTDGDIREVVRAVITSPEFRSSRCYGAKIMTPPARGRTSAACAPTASAATGRRSRRRPRVVEPQRPVLRLPPLRIPGHGDHSFQPHADHRIQADADHRFQRMSITVSSASRSLIPGDAGHFQPEPWNE